MIRQCAWCLRLINSVGERTSLLPVPKIYEATHGICQVCGTSWLEAVGGLNGSTTVITQTVDGQLHIQCVGEGMLPVIAPSPLPENAEPIRFSETLSARGSNSEDARMSVPGDELCLIG